MQDFLGLPNNPSIFSVDCEVANDKYHPFINSKEALSVFNTCNNPLRKNIITCKDEYLHEFLDEVDGLSLNLKLSSTIQNLPYYIPVFDERASSIPRLSSKFPVVSLTLNNILSSGVLNKAGRLHEETFVRLKFALLKLECFKDKKTILFNSGTDTLIESVWHKRSKIDFIERVLQMGFSYVCGFNFSLFMGECALAQSLNLKRSLYSSYLFEQAGCVTIPHVYALSYFQVNRWKEWFKSNPNICCCTINCQLQKTQKDRYQVIQLVLSLLVDIPDLHIILQGFSLKHIRVFGFHIERIHFAESKPLKLARSHIAKTYNMQDQKWNECHDLRPIEKLIEINFEERLRYIEMVRNECITDLIEPLKFVA